MYTITTFIYKDDLPPRIITATINPFLPFLPLLFSATCFGSSIHFHLLPFSRLRDQSLFSICLFDLVQNMGSKEISLTTTQSPTKCKEKK